MGGITMASSKRYLDILSKECKAHNHTYCHGKWQGFGFQVICRCSCGHKGSLLLKEDSADNRIEQQTSLR